MAKDYPDFFKVFSTEKHTERMRIPNAFVNLMRSKRKVIKDFILRDRRGRDWHVKARLIGDELYFDGGWKQFREENSLEEDDFLVFTHIENTVFRFKILELSSMCEKKKVSVVEENNNMEDEEEVNDGDDDDEDDDYEYDAAAAADDDGDDDDENERMYKEISRSKHQHCRTCCKCKAGNIGSSSARSKLEDDEIDAEIYIQPGNPHFIAKYIHSRPNELFIPKNVIKDFCLCFTKHVTLECCHCKLHSSFFGYDRTFRAMT
ncbi:B3 domain-containing protein At1g49475 isoform X2 [Medicago truncatula]|uniref:B3 domain-containing protein At1g49475 isoform X2 n=1 Tax=Medicago truncatula TaxID=3880 RepID=UPI000D2F2343|nr:B3 domain-containing protein At1g49475 isoform X2 [Medicago truncatula]